jgi:ankyrin repeat protein
VRLSASSARRLPAAAKANDWETVRQMLREHGPTIVNSVDKGGSSIIHWAIRHGNTQFAKVRLEHVHRSSYTGRPQLSPLTAL